MHVPEPGARSLLVITNLFPNPLEPQRSTFNERQLVALAARTRIRVVCPVSWLSLLRYRRQHRLDAVRQCTAWKGVPVSYPTYWYVPRFLGWIRGVLMAGCILPSSVRAARELDARAVLATWAYPDGFAGVLVGRLARLPVSIKVHGTDIDLLDGVGWLRRRMTLWALRRAETVIAVSRYLRDALVARGVDPTRIRVVYNGIDADTFRLREARAMRDELGLPPGRPVVLFVGGLKIDKGISELLDPLPLAACARRGALLAIIGSGPFASAIPQRVRAAGMESSVRILGQRTPAEIARWMAAADFLCLPSYHEGLPNVVLEALSCGLPVLATDVGGIPEIVSEANGHLVAPKRADLLAAGIERMLARSWDRQRVRATCPARSWAESAEALDHAVPGR